MNSQNQMEEFNREFFDLQKKHFGHANPAFMKSVFALIKSSFGPAVKKASQPKPGCTTSKAVAVHPPGSKEYKAFQQWKRAEAAKKVAKDRADFQKLMYEDDDTDLAMKKAEADREWRRKYMG